MTSTKILNILDEHPNRFTTLQKILKKNSLQKEWTKQVRSLVKATANQEFTVTDVSKKKLTIYCHNSSAATQIKYLEPVLIEELRRLATFSQIEKIVLKVGK